MCIYYCLFFCYEEAKLLFFLTDFATKVSRRVFQANPSAGPLLGCFHVHSSSCPDMTSMFCPLLRVAATGATASACRWSSATARPLALLCTQLSLILCPPGATAVRCPDSTWKMNLCHQDEARPASPRGIPALSPLTGLMNLPLPAQAARKSRGFKQRASAPSFSGMGQPQRNISLRKEVTRLKLTDRLQMQFERPQPHPHATVDWRRALPFSKNVGVLVDHVVMSPT